MRFELQSRLATDMTELDRKTLQQIESLPGFSFWKKQLGLLGDLDPGTVLAGTPDKLAELAARFPEPLFHRQALQGKWTPCQILGHLCDVEWIFGYRLRTILADGTPLLQGADQEKWAAAQHWNARPLKRLLEAFSQLRRINLDFWEGLAEDDHAKAGRHAEADVLLSIGLLQRILAGHDLSHLGQINRYLEILAER